jgi:hypothetical protein
MSALEGRSVLVRVTDSFAAGYIGEAFTGRGARLVGPVRDLADCAACLDETPIDVAVLSLDETPSDILSFAALFRERGIPLIFVSTGAADLPPELQDLPRLCRPYASFQVAEAAASLISGPR